MYTCPMHPEVRQEGPGKCPKCGMALVPEETLQTKKPRIHVATNMSSLGPVTWKSYIPLFVIFTLLIVSSWIVSASLLGFVQHFMTGFFLVFAGFKLLDLKGFAEGYSTYDILAQKWYGYGYLYPFIELGFGLAMLAGVMSPILLWAEVFVMLFSGVGVAIKLAKGEQFQCACLGTFLKVPLTYVTLIEDFGMALLALALLFAH